MPLDVRAMERRLCEQLCSDVRFVTRPDGSLMLRTGFEFPDGDRFPIHVAELAPGAVRLTDRGHTLMHLSYDHDMDMFFRGARGALLDQIVAESNIDREGAVLSVNTTIEELPATLFRYGQALTRIYDLGFLSRSGIRSTFYEDLADILSSLIPDDRIQRDYIPAEIPRAEDYPVDYCVTGATAEPLFLYGIPNRDKARLTTIMLSYFHRQNLNFDSLLVFEDQAEIPRRDLAHLSDVGGEMVSSLNAQDDLARKLSRRLA